MTSKPVNIRSVHTSEEFYSLKDAWNTLLAESPANSFFLRWEWLLRWWEVYNDSTMNLSILLVLEDGELIGIGPFYVKKQKYKKILRARRLLFLGTKEGSVISQYMDIICREGKEKDVVGKIMEYVVKEDICDDMSLQMLDSSSRALKVLYDKALEMNFFYASDGDMDCPCLTLPASHEEFLKGLSSSMRQNVRQNNNKVKKYPDVVFRKTLSIGELEKDFPELVRLHQGRWQSRNMKGSFAGGNFFNFIKAVMPEMLKNGHLELNFLSVSGRNIASVFNINYNGKIYYYQAGTDVSFNSVLSPGIIIHDHCIAEAIKNGLREYDFMVMGKLDDYKKKWTAESKYIRSIYMARPGIMKIVMSTRSRVRTCYRAIRGIYHKS